MATLDSAKRVSIITRDFLLVCLASMGNFSAMSFLIPVLPLYAISLGATKGDIGLIIGTFAVTALITRPFIGRAVDQRGSKRIMMVGSFLMALSTGFYIVARNVPALLVLRALHGAAMGATTTAAFSFVAAISPPHRRGEAMGVYGLFMNFTFAAGPLAGLFLAETYGYNAFFLVMVAIATLGLILVIPLVDPNTGGSHVHGQQSPLISRSAIVPSLVFFAMTSTMAPIIAFLPLFAQERGLGNVGVFFALQAATAFLVRTPAGRLSDTHGRAPVIMVGLLFLFAGMNLLAHSFSSAMFLGAAAVHGLGLGTVQPALLALVVDRAGDREQGAAMATTTAAMDLGVATGSLVWGLLAERAGYTTVYTGASAMALMGLAVLLAWMKRQQKVAS